MKSHTHLICSSVNMIMWSLHLLFKSFMSNMTVLLSHLWKNVEEEERKVSTICWNLPTWKKMHLCLSKWNTSGHVRKTKRTCKYFQELFSNECQKITKITLSGYITDGEGTKPCFECLNVTFLNLTTSNQMLRKLMFD